MPLLRLPSALPCNVLPHRLGLAPTLLGLVLVPGCEGKTGDDGDATATAGDTMTTGTGETDGTGTTSTATNTNTTTTTGPTTSDTSDTGGVPYCPDPNQGCQYYPPPCVQDDSCGEKSWDENGCFRGKCSWDEDCEAGERCWRPSFFAPEGCGSSSFGCSDNEQTMSCDCYETDDCNTGSGTCWNANDYPVGTAGPVTGEFDNDCAPNDGTAFTLRLGGTGSCTVVAPEITLSFYEALTPGVHRFDNTDYDSSNDGFGSRVIDDIVTAIVAAEIEITISGSEVSGSYRVWFAQDNWVYGNFTSLPYCNSDVVCG